MNRSARTDRRCEAPIAQIDVCAFTVPTDRPESDGTFKWDSTTIVIVEVEAAGVRGLGYTYADASTALLIRSQLAGLVIGCDAMAIAGIWWAMRRSVRNLGAPGIAAMAISGVDNALWDLKARLLDQPLVTLLGAVRNRIAAYGSGGFTSYSEDELDQQLRGWADAGFRLVKMKVGRDAAADIDRVRTARNAIGDQVELFVDANGAYTLAQAIGQAHRFAEHRVTWFEEPVSSDDLAGLRQMRVRSPPGMAIAAGEYGYTPQYFRQMLAAEAVDALQADATRCCGVTGFMQAGALAEAFDRPLSSHTAPSLHAHLCCAVQGVSHLEYFHDHARLEQLLFDGALQARGGDVAPDLSRPGLGLELKRADAARYAA